MEKLAIKPGILGSGLGILAGLIEMSIGAQILPWIGNKESPVVLGLITFFLSGIALLSVLSARNHVKLTNDRKLAIFFGVLFTSGNLLYHRRAALVSARITPHYDMFTSRL
ncbi:hypothetical protein EO95_00485 [Methanosarcina sp. 1.H.T.1A.1]|uniref:hypothetical protein n=1 Tax=Methanosarcina sp. 1.H.T.1A.1 TaxID=1483602 RepID=UPI0006219955|nr:hypothetical protein [Methanosarcina sp. 1.H.T.1A.1]KKH95083.1 hypothetical protein EO95_00485 [Methanosarcina sp. 1.H.T.1A.1]